MTLSFRLRLNFGYNFGYAVLIPKIISPRKSTLNFFKRVFLEKAISISWHTYLNKGIRCEEKILQGVVLITIRNAKDGDGDGGGWCSLQSVRYVSQLFGFE